jgi:GDP-L-fucose synthase
MKKKIFTEAIMKSNKNIKIFVSGHKGMVGSSIIRNLLNKGYKNIIVADKKKLDLTNQIDVIRFMKKHRFDHVYISAAKVGGILANMHQPAEFIYDNTMIATNLIHSSLKTNVKKVLFFGSSCIYPKKNKIPIKEKSLLSGYLEPTNLPYAISKILGLIMCKSYNLQYKSKTIFRAVMPTNLYGLNDKYDPINSHVIPALIYKFHKAKINSKKSIKLLGTGRAKRDFLFVDDLTDFAIKYLNANLNKKFQKDFVNIGSGREISIKKLAYLISEVVGYNGQIIFDKKSPDGHLSKLLDNSFSKQLGFKVKTKLKDGLKIAYMDFLKHYA